MSMQDSKKSPKARVLPDLTSGALTLLVIALKKDRDKRLTRGPALRAACECVAMLPHRCRSGERAVCALLGVSQLPPNLFRFCALLLDAVERRISGSEAEGTRGERRWKRSEYDHPILLALGQTVARAARMTRLLGPDSAAAIARLADADPRRLQQELLANYIGNVLQDYFDACQVRLKVRDLPGDTEEDLRRVDARKMAEWVCADTPSGAVLPVEQVEQRLGQLMTAVFLEEGNRTRARRGRSSSDAERSHSEDSAGVPRDEASKRSKN